MENKSYKLPISDVPPLPPLKEAHFLTGTLLPWGSEKFKVGIKVRVTLREVALPPSPEKFIVGIKVGMTLDNVPPPPPQLNVGIKFRVTLGDVPTPQN